MKWHCTSILCLSGTLFLTAMAMAQDQSSTQDADTSAANAAIQALAGTSNISTSISPAQPAESSTQDSQIAATIAGVQKLRADAQAVSKLSSKALQNQGSQNADTSAAWALLKQKADNLIALTPDADTVTKDAYLQNYREDDAESKHDLELFKECVADQLPDLAQTTDPDAKDKANAVLCASRPSFTAGPTKDQGPLFTPGVTKGLNDTMSQYSNAWQQYEQALQDVSNAISNSSTKTMPNSSEIKATQAPQIKTGPRIQPQPIPDCVLRHYACNK